MSALASLLGERLHSVVLAQAVRLGELAARRGSDSRTTHETEVGGDLPLAEEPLHLAASDRMTLVLGDVAALDDDRGRLRITANVMGLAGATPALPAYYSEIQLQRRRLKDRSLARFFNVFDHRALSFFYRAFRKHNALIAFEREARPGQDAVSRAMLALSGFATASTRDRLSFDDTALVPLAHHLGDSRRTAASLGIVLRQITGLDLRICEATPTWLALPADTQSRLGSVSARLGGSDSGGLGHADAAILGAAVLDIQHHYIVDAGPLSHAELLRFCEPAGPAATIAEACLLFTGIAYRPSIRLRIAASDIPPLQLGSPTAPAYLGRTAWMGTLGPAVREDCVISIVPGAIAA